MQKFVSLGPSRAELMRNWFNVAWHPPPLAPGVTRWNFIISAPTMELGSACSNTKVAKTMLTTRRAQKERSSVELEIARALQQKAGYCLGTEARWAREQTCLAASSSSTQSYPETYTMCFSLTLLMSFRVKRCFGRRRRRKESEAPLPWRNS